MRKLFTLLCIISAMSVFGQFNLKVGYEGFYGNFKATNKVLKEYNDANTLNKAFSSLNYLQGLHLGLRYKWNSIGIEGGWTNIQSSKLEAIGDNNNENWRVSNSQFNINLENYIGSFGLGVSAGYNTMRYKRKITGTRDRADLLTENFLSYNVYGLINVSSGITGISIKISYTPQLNSYSTGGFNESLGAGSTDQEYYKGFGVSLILYNGRQE